MTASTQSVAITKYISGNGTPQQDTLTLEEPLGISLRYGMELHQTSLSVTMRTPGQDEELALGFLLSEGIITDYQQITGVVQESENQVTAILQEAVPFDPGQFERHVYTTSSCGICGKASIDAIRVENKENLPIQNWKVNPALIYQLPNLLRKQQPDFANTGGLHASALFDQEGELLLLREDVGRHNALDKLVGAAMKAGMLPLEQYILLLSGRTSFELIQKAALAGISFVAAVGAPSSLAVALASEMQLALIGFLREDHFNVYTGAGRISS